MKNKLRLTSLLLVLLLLASSIGCSMPGIGTDSGEGTQEKATTTVPPEDIVIEETTWDSVEETDIPADTTEFVGPYTEPVPVTTPDPFLTDDPPELPDYNFGETVRILFGSDAVWNEFSNESSGAIIDDSTYMRKIKVEERFNVKLETTEAASNASHAAEYVDLAKNMHNAGEPFNIYSASRRAMSMMLSSNLLRDLSEMENVDLSKPWYPETLTEDLAVKGAVFFVTGDISPNAILEMNAIFYNKSVAERFERKNIVSRVIEGTWTLDALMELSQGVYIDEDASGSKTAGDMYGFTQSSYLYNDAFYSGSDLKFYQADPTSAGYVIASDDMKSAKANELATKLYAFFEDPSSFVGPSYNSAETVDFASPFADGMALFCHGTLSLADKDGAIRKLEAEYGILPIPKYDTNQEEYITTLSSKAVFWGVNRYSEKDDMNGALIEAMAYYGYTDVAPVVYENVMKQRYAGAGESAEMYDLLRASIRVDIGKMFAENASAINDLFSKCVRNGASEWQIQVSVTSFRQQTMRAEKELENIFERALKETGQ